MIHQIQKTPKRIAFVGFGEAAQAFLKGWGSERPAHVTAYDIKTENIATAQVMKARYEGWGVEGCTSLDEAVFDANAVFSLVTADQALAAARMINAPLANAPLWLDCNSCAPETKRQVGQASAIKMARSIMIKGMEALMAERFLATRCAGVEGLVLASLSASNPEIDWARRAAEMREVPLTVAQLGLPNTMSAATANWQGHIAALGLDAGDDGDLIKRLDLLLAQL